MAKWIAPRLTRNITPISGRRSYVEDATAPVPDIGDGSDAYIKMFEDEAKLLEERPTLAAIEDLLRNKWFRYFMVRLKGVHNSMVDATFMGDGIDFKEHRGKVQGLRSALGLPGAIYHEALNRGGVEEEAGVDPPGDFDDFGGDVEVSKE